MPLSLLLQRPEYVAIDKPSGLAVHRGMSRDPTVLTDLILQSLGWPKAHLVHRLDRGTSGVVLVAASPEAARELAPIFSEGRVTKLYWAIVRGAIPDEGVVDHAIPSGEDRPRVPARSRFRCIERVDADPRTLSWVEVQPLTGRFHQVRRHLKHLRHPVIGDSNYGVPKLNREIAARYGLGRLALHARTLAFVDPFLGEEVTITAPLPDDLIGPMERLGFGTARLK